MSINAMIRNSIAVIAGLVLTTQISAQATGGPTAADITPPGANLPPEQAAIDACVEHKPGDRVKFVDAKGKTHKWRCAMEGDVLAARSGVATAAFEIRRK